MITPRWYALFRWLFMLGLLFLVLRSALAIITHPSVITTAGSTAVIYLALFVVAVIFYSWWFLFRIRGTTPSERLTTRQGNTSGLLGGGIWILEVVVANVISTRLGAFQAPLYAGLVLAGYFLPIVAALLTTRETGQIRWGVQAGLLTGMIGGLSSFSSRFFPSLVLAVLQTPKHSRNSTTAASPTSKRFWLAIG